MFFLLFGGASSAGPTGPQLIQVAIANADVTPLFDGDVSVTRPDGAITITALGGSVEVLE